MVDDGKLQAQKALGKMIRDFREGRGLTQAEAAKAVGISRQQWNRIEKGVSGTERETIWQMALLFKLRLKDIELQMLFDYAGYSLHAYLDSGGYYMVPQPTKDNPNPEPVFYPPGTPLPDRIDGKIVPPKLEEGDVRPVPAADGQKPDTYIPGSYSKATPLKPEYQQLVEDLAAKLRAIQEMETQPLRVVDGGQNPSNNAPPVLELTRESVDAPEPVPEKKAAASGESERGSQADRTEAANEDAMREQDERIKGKIVKRRE